MLSTPQRYVAVSRRCEKVTVGKESHRNDHPKKGIRKEACWAISNITAGTAEQIETVLSFSSIMKKIVELAEHANWDVRKEAVRTP